MFGNFVCRRSNFTIVAHQAADGILLLRNIDELAAEPQGQLLRYLRAFETARSAEMPGALPSPSQVICTSRKPLRTQVLEAAFSPEIYYRLNAVSFTLPSLRDRKEDIPALAQMFVDDVSREQQRPSRGLGPGSLQILLRHLWPGNVRELESVIRAASLSGEGQWLWPIDLVILPLEPAHAKDVEPTVVENYTLEGVIRRHILQVLNACNGNKTRASSKLGIGRSTLHRMLKNDNAFAMRAPEVEA